ncbi:MAG: F-box protein [Pseudomonadota bacterium]|nr:F-box protein [Pseudomonadota bacterium]
MMRTKLNESHTPQGSNSTNIESIPNEIMLMHFKYLSFKDWARFQVVSQRWKALLRHNFLWGNAKFLWGYTKGDTVLSFNDRNKDRHEYTDRLIREVVSSTDLKFNNMPVTLPFWGNSNPVQQAKQVANIEDINSYYDLAKVSSCYSKKEIREIVKTTQVL